MNKISRYFYRIKFTDSGFNEKVKLKKICFAWNGQRIPKHVNICVDNTEYFVLESNMRALVFDEDLANI